VYPFTFVVTINSHVLVKIEITPLGMILFLTTAKTLGSLMW